MVERKLTDIRRHVLQHIVTHETAAMGARVPDIWIVEANRSVEDGQTTRGADGRRITDAGRSALEASNA